MSGRDYFHLDVEGDRIVMQGELDALSCRFLREAFEQHPDAVLLDLSALTYIDSQGIEALVSARRQNNRLRIVEASAIVRRLLEITGTDFLLQEGE